MDRIAPRSANEPTTLPLPFPELPREIEDLPGEAANEPPTDIAPPPYATAPQREPRFDYQPAWRAQDARLDREHLFARLDRKWREERRRRYLEALLTSQPEHELPWRPYGDPVTAKQA